MALYNPEPYKSDGGFSIAGLPVLLVILLAGAVALGWLASFIGQWFYLILIFPFFIGVGLIFIGIFAGHMTKMRSPLMAFFLGLFAATVAMGSIHFFDYYRLISPMGFSPSLNGFFAFMDAQAKAGVTIGRGNGINLGYTGSIIYWGLEWLGVTVFATFGLMGGASAPFCAECNTWKEEKKLGTLQGPDAAIRADLEEGNLTALAEYQPSLRDGELEIIVHVCPNCQSDVPIAVKLDHVTTDAKGEESRNELVQLTYPGEALAELEAIFDVAKMPVKRKRKRTEDDEE